MNRRKPIHQMRRALPALVWFGLVVLYGSPARADNGTSGWSTAAPLQVGREGIAATTGLDGKIYVLGGLQDGVAQSTAEVHAFDQWSTIAPMPTARWGLAAVTGPDGRSYAISGLQDGSGEVPTVEAYDPELGEWSFVTVGPGA